MIRALQYCVSEFVKDQALMDEREREDAIDGSPDTGPSGWREGTDTAETWVRPAQGLELCQSKGSEM